MTPAPERAGAVTSWRTLWRLRPFIAPHASSVWLALLLLIGSAGLDLLKPWPLKFIFDGVLGRRALDGTTIDLLVPILALVVAIAACAGLFNYLEVLVLNRAGRTIIFELRAALFDHLQRLSLRFHMRRSSGDLMTRFTADIKAFGDIFTEDLSELIVNVLFLAGMFAALFWLEWELALVVAAATPLLALVTFHYVFRIKAFSKAERKREGNLASVLHEALATISLTRVFNREEDAKRRFEAESAASLESGLAATLAEERSSWIIDIVAALLTAAVIGLGVRQVLEGRMSPGSLIVFVSYVNNLNKPLRAVMKHANRFARASARLDRVTELLAVEDEIADLPGAVAAPRFAGRIELRGVTFEYEPGRHVLDGIDLVIPERRVVALVGPTGAGKSTLVSLIPRLYEPTNGAVLIDSHDIRTYTLRSLRAQISVVLQESVLLRASIAENIAYGRPSATREEIVAAAMAANAHEFVSRLPDGYETVVGERGETLSGGQRQRIAIARAVIREAPILILDEPLTGLDGASAADVLDALERLMRGKTVILITHQLGVARNADWMLLLADGRIVREGLPGDVLREAALAGGAAGTQATRELRAHAGVGPGSIAPKS